MIHTNKGIIIAEGSEIDILTDVSTIISSLHEGLSKEIGSENAKKRIMNAIDVAFMTDEELDNEIEKTNKKIAEIDKKIEEARALLKGLGE